MADVTNWCLVENVTVVSTNHFMWESVTAPASEVTTVDGRRLVLLTLKRTRCVCCVWRKILRSIGRQQSSTISRHTEWILSCFGTKATGELYVKAVMIKRLQERIEFLSIIFSLLFPLDNASAPG